MQSLRGPGFCCNSRLMFLKRCSGIFFLARESACAREARPLGAVKSQPLFSNVCVRPRLSKQAYASCEKTEAVVIFLVRIIHCLSADVSIR